MKKLFFISLLITLSINGLWAQSWKKLYHEAEKHWDNDWITCEKILERALPLSKQNYDKKPTEDTTYRVTLTDLGLCKQELGNYELAEGLLIEAKRIQEKHWGKENTTYIDICFDLAHLYQVVDNYASAETLYLEARNLVVHKFGKKHLDYASCCNNLAVLYQDLGNYVVAEPLLQEVKILREEAFGKKHEKYATACNNLGRLYQMMGNYALAKPLFIEAKSIVENTLGKKHENYILACNNLAVLYQNMGDYTFAKPLLIEAKSILEKHYGKEHLNYTIACNNLAQLYQLCGEYDTALPLFEENYLVLNKKLGKKNIKTIRAELNLGNVHQDLQHYSVAESLFKELKSIVSENLGINHPDYSKVCHNLGLVYKNMDQFTLAEANFKESTSLKLRELSQNFNVLTESQKESYLKTNEYYFQGIYRIALKQNSATDDAYNIAVATKGFILNHLQNTKNSILNSTDNTLKHYYVTWQNLNKQMAQAYLMPIEMRKQKGLNLDSLYTLAQEIERKLSMLSAEFNIAEKENKITYQEIQQKLRPQEASIEMIRITEKEQVTYAALILTAQQTPSIVILPSSGKLLEKEYLTNYRRSARHKIQDTLSYQAYWKPIADYLSQHNIQKVYFSPEGVYHQINLNTLFCPTTKKFVLDEIKLCYVTNTKELVLASPTEKLSTGVLAGRPNYRIVSPQVQKSDWVYEDLEGTEKEVNQIAELLAKNQIVVYKYLDVQANKDTVLRQKSPSILHLATHGFFYPQSALSTQKMLQSGLVLSGGEILTAFEAMQMDLRHTELVCLSACETALGSIAVGEGVYGLKRAFKVAGAKTIIMSLWKVNDKATQELMTSFYSYWLTQHQSKQEAFLSAQNYLRTKYKDVYYWGAFVMVGE